MRPLITLTTDFGTGSPYVAQMKGVIYSICRAAGGDCEVVDLTHAIPPQSIREGAVVLADVAACFPAGTLHVAVVDPGVGSSRKILYVEIGTQRFLVPDNGLIGLAAREQWPSLRTLAFGDLLLEDIRQWRVRLYAAMDWDCLFPLFGSDTTQLARRMIEGGLRASLCCVDTRHLDAGFSGHAFDPALLDALPAGIDPCGENGEFHTCVSDGPMFATPLRLQRGESVLREDRYAYTDFRLG